MTQAINIEDARKLAIKLEKEKWEIWLLRDIKAVGLHEPQKQYLFHPKRQYKADICWPEIFLIVEVDGGTWLEHGGHQTGSGYEHDRIRDAEAFMLGYKVLRVTPKMIESGMAISCIEKLFKGNQ